MSIMVNLEYKFLVFLYSYMRQIDLSLDRSRWGPWNDLRNYYQFQINPVAVSSQLLKNSNLKLETPPIGWLPKKPSLLAQVKAVLLRFITKRVYLNEPEVLYCCQLLIQFDSLLNRNYSEYPLEAERLRIDIAKFYSYLLVSKMSKKDYYRGMIVEHFGKNENIKVVKIGEFASGVMSQ